MASWKAWTNRLLEVGIPNFYSPDIFADYFPGYLYLLYILGKIFSLISPQYINTSIFEFTLKNITGIFDILTSIFIYLLIKKGSATRWAILGAFIYLCSPQIIFNSLVWGQVDSIPTFLIVFSLYFLKLQRWYMSSFIYALAVLVKPQSLIISPLLFLFYIYHLSPKKLQKNAAIFLTIIFIASFPFFTDNPLLGLINLFNKSTSVYPYTSLFAFNIWAYIGFWENDLKYFANLTYQQIGFFTFVILLLLILYRFVKNETANIYLALSLLILTFFLFPTRIHERYLFPFFAIFLIYTCQTRSIKNLLIYISMSLIHFLNLFYVYYFYNFYYNNPNLIPNYLYSLIDNYYLALSGLSIFFFIILMIKYLTYAKKNS